MNIQVGCWVNEAEKDTACFTHTFGTRPLALSLSSVPFPRTTEQEPTLPLSTQRHIHTHTHTHTVHTFTYADTYTFTFTHLHTLKINRGIEQTNAQGYYTPRHNTNAQTHIRLHQMYTHTHTHTSLCKYMQRQTVT